MLKRHVLTNIATGGKVENLHSFNLIKCLDKGRKLLNA